MPPAQGMSQAIYLWPEDTVKTLPGTVNADKLPVIDPRFRSVRNTSKPNALTGSAEPRSTILGKRAFEFSMGVECNPSSMAPVLYYAMGGREQQGTSDLYHTRFRLGTLPSFGVEDAHTDISRFFGYLGGYIGQSDYSFSTEGAMALNVSGMGYSVSDPATATVVNGAVTDRTSGAPFSYLFGRVKKDGVKIGYVKAATLSINRALGRDAAIDETDEQAVIFSEVATVNGSVTALLDTTACTDLYQGGIDAADVEFEFFIPYGSGKGFWAVLPAAKLMPFSVVTNGTGLNTIEGNFEAQPGNVAGSARGKYFTTAALSGTTLVISVDAGGDQTVTFGVGDDSPEEAVTAINAGTTGCTAYVERKSGETGGVVVIESDSTGSTSSIKIQAASTADTLMGYDNATHSGASGISVELWLANTVVVA